MKKLLSLLMVLILTLSLFAACKTEADDATATPTPSSTPTAPAGDGGENNEESGSGMPFAGTPAELSVWCTFSNQQIVSMEDGEFVGELANRTGVTLTFLHPSTTNTAEAFNLMVAGQDYTDIIGSANLYTGGGEKAVEDEIYLQLNEHIDQFMPTYASFRARGGDYEKRTISDNGVIWAIYSMVEKAEVAWTGLTVRQDWLDDLGLGLPDTLDDWHNMLTRFKNEKGATGALEMPTTGLYLSGEFMSAWDIGRTNTTLDFYVENGTVKYGFNDLRYIEYLATMAQWYKEGLIDQDFLTRQDTGLYQSDLGRLGDGTAGAGVILWGNLAKALQTRVVGADESLTYEAVLPPVLQSGNTRHFGFKTSEVLNPWAISATSDNAEIACRVLDYLFTEEGSLLLNYGIEGVSYNMVDGAPVISDLIWELSEVGGSDAWVDALERYTWHNGPGLYDYTKLWQEYEDLSSLESAKKWDGTPRDYMMPTAISLTQDEGTEISRIMGDIRTLVEENTAKIINGQATADSYNAVIDQINSMGIEDAIAIYQAAYDRYMAR